MNYTLTLIFLLNLPLAYSQTTFTIDDFSADYYGKLYIEDTSEVFSKGWVAIIDKKSGKELIKVESDELTCNLHDGKVLANIHELPYGEQSQVIYNDFNFDGIRDFALMNGQYSCYHGPSFEIYLATDTGFKMSPEFTALAREYCGMFDLDSVEKKIYTMTKSGCCWHQFSEFTVENNKPKAIRIIEDNQADFPFNEHSEQIWNGTKMVKTSRKTIDLGEEGVKPVLVFKVEHKEKVVILFNLNDRILRYALIDKDDNVEFSFPIDIAYENPDFTFDTKKHIITFKNKDATYTIHNDNDKVGIDILISGKTYKWVGNNQTKTDDLADLLKTRLDNVVIR